MITAIAAKASVRARRRSSMISDVSGGEQPRHVRDDGDHVDVMVVQEIEAAERKQHGAEERCRLTESESEQEPDHSQESGRVIDNQLEIECRPEGKDAVQQLMKWVKKAIGPFACRYTRQKSKASTRRCRPHAAPAGKSSALGRWYHDRSL